MPSRQKLIFALVVLLIAAVTGFGASWLTWRQGGTVSLGEALVGGPFTLTDQNGKTVALSAARGHKVVLVFYRGYW